MLKPEVGLCRIVLEDIDSSDEYSLIDATFDLTVIREESVINIYNSTIPWRMETLLQIFL